MNYIKKGLFLYTFFILFLLSSCTPEKSELWFNEDGSGKMEMTIDMGEMAGMATGLMQSMGEDGDEPPKDMWGKEEKIDSTMVLYDMVPDSVMEKLENPVPLKQFKLNMHVDSEKEIALMKVVIDYKSSENLKEIFQALEEIQEKEGAAGGLPGGNENIADMFNNFDLQMAEGLITLEGVDFSDMKDDPEFEEMIKAMENPEKAEDPEFMKFFEAMFGGDMTTIVHAPREIISTNQKDAIIKGNTVTFKENILEMMKLEKVEDKVIQFKTK